MASNRAGHGGGLDLPPAEMRRLGYRVVDLLVDRWTHLREAPAWMGGQRGDLEPGLMEDPPEAGRDPDEVLARAVDVVLTRAGRIDHPRFFAFIPSSPTWPSVLADTLAAGFNIFQGTWLESAGPSQLEIVVLEWFRKWLALPETGGGLMTSGGSAANLVALVTARHRAGLPDKPVFYLSDQAHSSIERAIRIMGLPSSAVRRVPTDDAFRMDLAALRRSIAEDRDRGLDPVCLCANAGATNTGAVDPMAGVAAVAREEGLWFHVDGAYGGFAVLSPTQRERFRGIEEADSVTLDPHKWLFQPYETGCLMVRDTRVLEDAFRILPEYLQDAELGHAQVNFADRGVQLTRGFRALKVWMSIQMLGLGAFRDSIETGVRLGAEAGRYIRASRTLEPTAPDSLGIACFRFRDPTVPMDDGELEELNHAIQKEIVGSGLAMMSSTRLRGAFSLRLCVLNYRSTWDDVRTTLEAVEELGGRYVQRRIADVGRRPGP